MKPASAQARSLASAVSHDTAMLERLRAKAGADGKFSFRDFCAEALYAPGLGYYSRADLTRVGRKPESDFYTASSLQGGIYGRLLRAAAADLLGLDKANEYALVELAAEDDMGVFAGEKGEFQRAETRRLGKLLAPPSRAVVFANEWLDAQPFHRFVFREGAWRELGVQVDAGKLKEVELSEISSQAVKFAASLPCDCSDGYHLDISLEAEKTLGDLASAAWHGCLMLADYGYDWQTLIRDRPAGTARAYFQHQVSADLLGNPGTQDITCHVCWDRLENVLREHGFSDIRVESQESFFMGHAASAIEAIMTQETGKFSPGRQTLVELLHPAHLGRKFQILSARRL